MGLDVVVVWRLERNCFRHRFLTKFRIVLRVPLLLVGFTHGIRETAVVVAWARIFSGLGPVSQPQLGHFYFSLRSLQPVHLPPLLPTVHPPHTPALVASHPLP